MPSDNCSYQQFAEIWKSFGDWHSISLGVLKSLFLGSFQVLLNNLFIKRERNKSPKEMLVLYTAIQLKESVDWHSTTDSPNGNILQVHSMDENTCFLP